MPELPEVETIRRGLNKKIIGKTIRRVEVRLPKIISLGPITVSNIRKNSRAKAVKFENFLRGLKFTGVKRRAKMLLMDLSGPYTLLVHLKMTGQLIFVAASERHKLMKIFNVVGSRKLELPHQYTHVIFHFSDGSRLYYNDLRQFGYLRLVPDDKISAVKELRDFGPEPFSSGFTAEYLKTKARTRPKLSVKTFLMDPKVVAGVGNIYSDEILYCAGLRPMRRVKSLKVVDFEKLVKCSRKVLREGIVHRGSSVGDFFTVEGKEGTYGRVHRVYGRGGRTCRRCGSIIETAKFSGRTGSFCPVCQK